MKTGAAAAVGLVALAAGACSNPDSALPPAYRSVRIPENRLASAAARARGRRLFLRYCALCHGVNADGRGQRHEGFARPPQDFTSRFWRRQATPRTVYHDIREGISGTAMASWKSLGDDAVWDLAAYVLSVARPEP